MLYGGVGQKLCWHCQLPGHEKKQCVKWILTGELWRILPNNSSGEMREKVTAAVRATIVNVIATNKSGIGLRFCGRPDDLMMD